MMNEKIVKALNDIRGSLSFAYSSSHSQTKDIGIKEAMGGIKALITILEDNKSGGI